MPHASQHALCETPLAADRHNWKEWTVFEAAAEFMDQSPDSRLYRDAALNRRPAFPSIVSPEDLYARVCPRQFCAPVRPRRLINVAESHPFGQPRSASRFIDLHAVDELDTALHRLDVRHLFLVRNASDFMQSDMRRNFTASQAEQSRLLELSVAYLEAAFGSLHCGRTLLLPYEFMMERPAAAGAMIGRLLDADAGDERLLADALRLTRAKPRGSSHVHTYLGTSARVSALAPPVLAFWERLRTVYPAMLGGAARQQPSAD